MGVINPAHIELSKSKFNEYRVDNFTSLIVLKGQGTREDRTQKMCLENLNIQFTVLIIVAIAINTFLWTSNSLNFYFFFFFSNICPLPK